MSVLVTLQQLASDAPPASWWQLSPYIAVGVVSIVVGALTSRKGPRS